MDTVLNCHIYSRYKGAREIIHGTKYHMLKEGDVYSLIVNDVYGEDADEYVCRAVNKGGIKSTRAELIIMSKFWYLLLFDKCLMYNVCSVLSLVHHDEGVEYFFVAEPPTR